MAISQGPALPTPQADTPTAPTNAAAPPTAPAPSAPAPATGGSGTGALAGISLPSTPQFNTQGIINALQNYYKVPQQSQMAVAQANTQGNIAQQQYEHHMAQVQMQITKTQDLMDPSKYKVVQSAQGTKIVDPFGQEVSIGQYANATGVNPADVLKNSPNPQDQQFVSDYNNYQQFMQSVLQKNSSPEEKAIYDSFVKANPSLGNMTPDQLRTQFMSRYGNYFGVPQQGQTPGSAQYTPGYTQNLINYLIEKDIYQNQAAGNAPQDVANELYGTGSALYGGNQYGIPSLTGQ